MSVLNESKQTFQDDSWRLTKELKEVRNLFVMDKKINYLIEAFICRCGHVEYIIKSKNQEVKYKCSNCDNEEFFNANLSWHDTYEYNVKPEIKVVNKDTYLSAIYYLTILER